MGAILKKAITVANNISKQYMLLDGDNSDFFDQYHDSLQCQKSCAWEVVNDIEVYEERGDSKNLEYALKELENLNKTLIYCKAVIKLQGLVNELPEPIFG